MTPLNSSKTTRFTIKASEHPIESVTVFRSPNAQIVRQLMLSLKAGNNEVEIIGLSSSIDTESLRVSGLGGVRLADVVCVVDKSAHQVAEESQQIRDARLKIRDLKSEKETREEGIELLLRYGQSLGGTLVSPEQAAEFAEKMLTTRLASLKILHQLEDQISEQEKFIERAQKLTVGEARAKATITVVAQEDGLAQLTISYLVGNTRWTPAYDLHATSENGKPLPFVSLHYRVHLSQSTGEHWDATSLILSTTATDSLNVGIPEPKSLSIRARASTDINVRSSRHMKTIVVGSTNHPPGEPKPVYEGIAFVSKTPSSVTYTVEGQSTIPSDGERHKVSVVQLPFQSKISHVTVPRQEVLAYLQCEVKNTTDYHLLPGPVSVFMDKAYVSKTSIQDINTGDIFRCTLGIDVSTRISYSLTSASETSSASSFVEQYKTTKYISTTTIHNRHAGDYPISIIEKSSVPIAPENDNRIKVYLRKPVGLAESDNGVEVDLEREDGFKVKWSNGKDEDKGKKDGKFVWLGAVDPGSKVVLISEWEVRAPIDVDWTESAT